MKKTLLLAIAALFLATTAIAADGKGTLTVVLTGFKSAEGMAMISIFKSADGFPYETDKAVDKQRLPIKDGQAVAVFKELPYGTYAVAAFHDNDGSGKLERNAFGIPKKGYALSNEPEGFPNFTKSKFAFDAPDKSIRIGLKY